VYTTPGKLSTWHVPVNQDGKLRKSLLANPDVKVVAAVELASCLCCRWLGGLQSQAINGKESASDRTGTDGDTSDGPVPIPCRHEKIYHGKPTFIFAGPQSYKFYQERWEKARQQGNQSSSTSLSIRDTAGTSTHESTARLAKRQSSVIDAEDSDQRSGSSFKRVRDLVSLLQPDGVSVTDKIVPVATWSWRRYSQSSNRSSPATILCRRHTVTP